MSYQNMPDVAVRGRSKTPRSRDGWTVPEAEWFASRYRTLKQPLNKDALVARATHSGLVAACRRVGLADTDAEIRAALEHLRAILARAGGAP